MRETGADLDLREVARRYLNLTTPEFREALRAELDADRREGAVPEGEREHLESRIRALEHLVDQYRSGEVLPDDWTDREEGIEVEVEARPECDCCMAIHDATHIEPGPYTLSSSARQETARRHRVTKAERQELREIVKLFTPDDHGRDNWTEGYTRLCRLAGIEWPAGEAMMRDDVKSVDVRDFMARAGDSEEEA